MQHDVHPLQPKNGTHAGKDLYSPHYSLKSLISSLKPCKFILRLMRDLIDVNGLHFYSALSWPTEGLKHFTVFLPIHTLMDEAVEEPGVEPGILWWPDNYSPSWAVPPPFSALDLICFLQANDTQNESVSVCCQGVAALFPSASSLKMIKMDALMLFSRQFSLSRTWTCEAWARPSVNSFAIGDI